MYHTDSDGYGDEDENMYQYTMDDTLDGITRVEKYYNSDFNLQRLVLAREIYETAVEAGYQDSEQRLLPLLQNFVKDTEPAVREEIAKNLHSLSLFFVQNAPNNTEGFGHLTKTFIPFAFELIVDKKSDVADAAIEALVEMAKLIRKDQVQSELLDVVVKLGKDDRIEEYRIASAKLYNELSPVFGEQLCRDVIVMELRELAADESLVVRKVVSQNLEKICTIIGQECTVTSVLPFFSQLAKDDIWGVRKACVESFPSISKNVTPKVRVTILMDLFESLIDDVSRWVKMEAYKQLGPFIATFKSNEISDSLVKYFTDMAFQSEHNDSDLVEFCAFNFPAVAITLGKERWNLLEPSYILLTKDVQWKVRRSLASSLHEIAQIVGPDITERVLCVPFESFLQDLDEVKFGIVCNLAKFLGVLKPKARKSYIKLLCELPAETENWRIRNEIAKQLGALAELFSIEEVREHILKMAYSLFDDPFYFVRNTALEQAGPILKVISSDRDALDEYIAFMKSLANAAPCYKRQMFLLAAQSMMDFIDPKMFDEAFFPFLPNFANDRVANVRLALAQLINNHLLQLDHWKNNTSLQNMLSNLRTDKDRDVQYFASASIMRQPKVSTTIDNEDQQPIDDELTE